MASVTAPEPVQIRLPRLTGYREIVTLLADVHTVGEVEVLGADASTVSHQASLVLVDSTLGAWPSVTLRLRGCPQSMVDAVQQYAVARGYGDRVHVGPDEEPVTGATYSAEVWEPWGRVPQSRDEMVHVPWRSVDHPGERATIVFSQDQARGVRKAHVTADDSHVENARLMMISALVEHAESVGETIDPDSIEDDVLPDGYEPGVHIVRATGTLASEARVEMSSEGVEWFNADGESTFRVDGPPPERPDPVVSVHRPRLTRRGRTVKRLAWTLLALALIAGAVVGIVAANVAEDHHEESQRAADAARTDAAIKACSRGGGTYLYGGGQLVRLYWQTSALDAAGELRAHPHEDVVVTVVPHTGGGMCLTPTRYAVSR